MKSDYNDNTRINNTARLKFKRANIFLVAATKAVVYKKGGKLAL